MTKWAGRADAPISEAVRERFIALEARLSPENLSSDGEASRAEQRRRLAEIRREWKVLEREVGRTVEAAEVDRWWAEKYLDLSRAVPHA